VAPALPVVDAELVVRLDLRLAARGVTVDAAATLPSWDGGEVDYGWEVDWLRSLGRRAVDVV
jgi:hypothetical protein